MKMISRMKHMYAFAFAKAGPTAKLDSRESFNRQKIFMTWNPVLALLLILLTIYYCVRQSNGE
jgi:hypothetical protein